MKASHVQLSLLVVVVAVVAYWAIAGQGASGSGDSLGLADDGEQGGGALKAGPTLPGPETGDGALSVPAVEDTLEGESRQVVAAEDAVLQQPEPEMLEVLVRARRWNSLSRSDGIPDVGISLVWQGVFQGEEDGATAVGRRSLGKLQEVVPDANAGAPLLVTTGPDGNAMISMPWPEGFTEGAKPGIAPALRLDRTRHLEVIGLSYSYQEFEDREVLALDVTLSAVLKGHVVDTAGNPVACLVELYQNLPDGSWWRRSGVDSNSKGEFEFPVTREGVYVVRGTVDPAQAMGRSTLVFGGSGKPQGVVDWAPVRGESTATTEPGKKLGLGSGVSPILTVDFARAPELPLVVVDGQGVLRGRVVDRSGAPVAGLALLALHRDMDNDQRTHFKRGLTQFGASSTHAPSLDQWGKGNWGGSMTTSSDGTFELLGLRPGDFVLRAKPSDTAEVFSKLLTSTPVESNGANLEIEFSLPRVLIHLVDPEGRPMPQGWESVGETTNRGWSPHLQLTVDDVACADGDPSDSKQIRPRFVGNGAYEFTPSVECTFEIRITGASYPKLVQKVVVPPGSDLVEVTVVVDKSLVVGEE